MNLDERMKTQPFDTSYVQSDHLTKEMADKLSKARQGGAPYLFKLYFKTVLGALHRATNEYRAVGRKKYEERLNPVSRTHSDLVAANSGQLFDLDKEDDEDEDAKDDETESNDKDEDEDEDMDDGDSDDEFDLDDMITDDDDDDDDDSNEEDEAPRSMPWYLRGSDISETELKAYFAIFFHLGLDRVNSIKECWNHQQKASLRLSLYKPEYQSLMSWYRFKQIHRCLHMPGFANRESNQQTSYEWLRTDLNLIIKNFYRKSPFLSLDDDLYKWMGFGGGKKMITGKADRCGVTWKLVDENKYIYHFSQEYVIKANGTEGVPVNKLIMDDMMRHAVQLPGESTPTESRCFAIDAGVLGTYENVQELSKRNQYFIVSLSRSNSFDVFTPLFINDQYLERSYNEMIKKQMERKNRRAKHAKQTMEHWLDNDSEDDDYDFDEDEDEDDDEDEEDDNNNNNNNTRGSSSSSSSKRSNQVNYWLRLSTEEQENYRQQCIVLRRKASSDKEFVDTVVYGANSFSTAIAWRARDKKILTSYDRYPQGTKGCLLL
ncbi:hypothetical protein SAMD00019534_025990 [Acytostelium subglobosum LB1]|uniref:hypothetical protein n=1 Tax=Acytostelium subglobosum LB1 TaxID=1410327 RepID=UPI000644E9E7|nr:hypothetical protein SAMD00019534_025990 [Acytostelium subglobosum LB1]GAM19424.1 hypothetical protein SAMD00019534_025990 [Acytostelium subglobosum LB1]|eukprot:XP_012757351.1 hypothetical protein SAMD00019534_025990 [Acytostelium subglobosum LB1]